MKTLKITTVFFMIALFAGFTSAYSANRDNGQVNRPGDVVRYQVNVHTTTDLDFCNAYLVVLIDGHGNTVAPSQGYNPRILTYTFTESNSTPGVRGARIIINPEIQHFVCVNDLSSAPVFKMGPFMTGQSYTFDLYPESKNVNLPKEAVTPKD